MGQIGKKKGIITVSEPLKAPLVIPVPTPVPAEKEAVPVETRK